MPIVKHISVHSTPLSCLKYILNGEKNDEMKYASGINCPTETEDAYEFFRHTFEHCTHERFYKESLNGMDDRTAEKRDKEKVRLHHYIQSFDPNENISPEEAHRIGLEWAEKNFGKQAQVIISTHLDKGHVHNHFAVCPYTLDGRHIVDNMKTLQKARKLSDEISKEHGISIIEKPKHKNTMKYNEWLAKKQHNSWKDKLCDVLDDLVRKSDVQSMADLIAELNKQGYEVKQGKYLSVKAPKQRNAIRSFRLGDGYSVENLEYRIRHKDMEITEEDIKHLSGFKREYALCLVQMNVKFYRQKSQNVTYSDLRKSTELLNFISRNNINSVQELENMVNAAAESYNQAEEKRKALSAQVAANEKIIADGKTYLELLDKDYLTDEDKVIYKKVEYVENYRIGNRDDLAKREQQLSEQRTKLSKSEEQSELFKSERRMTADMYTSYLKYTKENPLPMPQEKERPDKVRQEENRERRDRRDPR